MEYRQDISASLARSLVRATENLIARGASELEIGNALVAAGISRLSTVVPLPDLAEHLSEIATALNQPDQEPVVLVN